MERITLNPAIDHGRQRYEAVEAELFRIREAAENIWIRIAELCTEVVEYRLYRYAQDEDGNYFRTAKRYFEHLDQRWEQRGWHAKPGTLNKWMDIYRLFVQEMKFTPDEMASLGISNAKALAPVVRQLQREGRMEEAQQAVVECVEAAQVHGGLPLREVATTIDYLTGRVEKGFEVKFSKAMFGRQLHTFRLWWGSKPIDLLNKQQVSEEQYEWIMRRLGQRIDD